MKHLLLAIDGSQAGRAAQDFSFWFARGLDAKLDAVHVMDSAYLKAEFMTDISASMGFEPFGDFTAREEQILRELGDLIVEQYRTRAGEEGLQSSVIREEGSVGPVLLDVSLRSDLLIMGRKGVNASFHQDRMGSTTEYVLRRVRRPMVVVPEKSHLPEKFLVGFDESDSSFKALRHAAELAKRVSLPLTVVHAVSSREAESNTLNIAREYLSPYEIEYDTELLSGHAEETILDYVRKEPNYLLFLGIHGHSRWIELLLGSTVEYIVNRSTVPVYCTP